MDKVASALDQTARFAETAREPEGDGDEETDEDGERNEPEERVSAEKEIYAAQTGGSPVSVTVGEELLAERAHCNRGRVVLLDDPTGPETRPCGILENGAVRRND